MTALRLGTRGSALALAQARSVAALLPGPVELVKITTAGDVDRLHGDKSRWIGALEAALRSGDIDLAVHSAKDVPGEIASGTDIVATPRRAEPFDALVGDLREGARVGTSALRRRAQLLASHPGVTVVDLRGNVDTRLKKREAGEVDTLVLAAAGLDRLGRRREADSLLVGGVFVPAPGQGVIAVQGRVGSEAAAVAAAAITHARTQNSTTSASWCARWAPVATRRSACSRSRGVCVRSSGSPTAPSSSWRRPRAPAMWRGACWRPAPTSSCAPRRAPPDDAPRPRVTVFLVGAGPGDPGLMTVRARDLIAAADVILHDRLIPPGALDGAREDAELVYVGKIGGGPQMPQEEIDRLLVQYGTGDRTVVRLKGGDPFVFGRGGEEAQVLRAAGIPFEIVPGITAGIAAPAYAGIPVTHRDFASGVAFVTGHEDGTLDWDALAAFPGTLVFYMGVKALPRIAERLVAGGRPPNQPVAVVERGTLPGQKTVVATLADIASRAEGIRAPAITLVGEVAGLHEQIAWLESRPLFGRTVAVTRARAQASALAERLRGLGAEVVEAPAIRTRALEVSLPDVRSYDLLCVTSPTGATHLFDHLRDARDLAGVTVAAIGPGTVRALRSHGVEADVVPDRAVAEGLVEALVHVPVTRALIARAAEARDVLPDALRERGAAVDVVALYETVPEPLSDEAREAAAACDYVLFTSASSVRFFAGAGGALSGPRLVSIGPATSEELRAHGAEPDLEADPHTPDGLVAALLSDAT